MKFASKDGFTLGCKENMELHLNAIPKDRMRFRTTQQPIVAIYTLSNVGPRRPYTTGWCWKDTQILRKRLAVPIPVVKSPLYLIARWSIASCALALANWPSISPKKNKNHTHTHSPMMANFITSPFAPPKILYNTCHCLNSRCISSSPTMDLPNPTHPRIRCTSPTNKVVWSNLHTHPHNGPLHLPTTTTRMSTISTHTHPYPQSSAHQLGLSTLPQPYSTGSLCTQNLSLALSPKWMLGTTTNHLTFACNHANNSAVATIYSYPSHSYLLTNTEYTLVTYRLISSYSQTTVNHTIPIPPHLHSIHDSKGAYYQAPRIHHQPHQQFFPTPSLLLGISTYII